MTRPPLTGAAIVVLGENGLDVAQRLRTALPDAHIHGLARRVDGADVHFADVAAHLASLFSAGVPIIGVCASGILIRALAPVLGDKRAEPPVVAVAADGQVAVPLLGGHGGANDLARAIAHATGAAAAITTAGETSLGMALDAPPPGWTVANPDAAKPIMAALLAGEPVRLVVEAGDPAWLDGLDTAEDAAHTIRVTDRVAAPAAGELVLHPPSLALGVGCERGTDPMELETLARTTLAAHGLAASSVACVVSLDLKEDEPAVAALAASLGVPARFFDALRLEAETPRLAHPSETVYRAVGCHGVAEAASLAAAGGAGVLVAPKHKSVRATCAIARGVAIDPLALGRARGSLTLLGAGPGASSWRTSAVVAAAASASDAVGYGPYLDLMGDVLAHAHRHAFDLGEEELRGRKALGLAAEGKNVVLVASGDPGIYAMASLIFELLDRTDDPAWARIAITVEPGVSAMQMAAARAGAPLGHDFCAISLSDLMTPWSVIEARLRAAADADFVVALYNPRSARRTHQLPAARDILLARRPPQTPVVVARELGRANEHVEIVTLAELDPDRVDMLTVLIVGSSETRIVAQNGQTRVYTPRGYGAEGNAP